MKVVNKEELLGKYYSYTVKFKWKKAKGVLIQLLELEPNSFWLWTSLSSVSYEMRNYKKALNHSIRAYELNPNSPLVLWDFACVLFMLNKEKKAIKLWKRILEIEERKIAYELTSEGLKWARSLINDSRYRIGEAYYYIEKDKKAKDYLLSHLKHRRRGVKSLYKKRDVKKMLEKVSLEIDGCQMSD